MLPARNPVALEGVMSTGGELVGRCRVAALTRWCSEAERAELEHRAACYTRPHREVQRAKLVLLAADGETNTEIGERLGMSREAVGRWRRRFCERRLEGLEDFERTG